jgi:hypothetical protein
MKMIKEIVVEINGEDVKLKYGDAFKLYTDLCGIFKCEPNYIWYYRPPDPMPYKYEWYTTSGEIGIS